MYETQYYNLSKREEKATLEVVDKKEMRKSELLSLTGERWSNCGGTDGAGEGFGTYTEA